MADQQWGNLPQEMRSLPQWLVWRYVATERGMTKIPICANTGGKASVTDPSTWVTFETAVAAASRYNGIGFVLTPTDPFVIIDLDNKPEHPCTPEQLARHQRIYDAFESYTELSVSGTGVHIIVKGEFPGGFHRDNVEVYGSARYMACTGNLLRSLPIRDHQPLLDILAQEMAPRPASELVSGESDLSDADLVAKASSAVNGDKFDALCAGDLTGYPSQSEADLALLSMLCFYTPDNEQVRRIFRASKLGQREKAQKNDTYINFCLRRIRSSEPAPVDFTALAEQARLVVEQLSDPVDPTPSPSTPTTSAALSWPPGLVGEIASYIYEAAVRPVPEVAIAAAIALLAGLTGRSYNISGTGLNQYLILLARTGSGKEGAASGIESLIAAIRHTVPMADQFMGPAAFASGQALIKTLAERPCFVSVLGEFGLTLQQLSSARASSAEIMLRKVLLDLYGKSGWNQTLRSSVYADIEKNTKVVQAPAVTILGESTPETFFDGLDATHIAEGLIPRFSIIQYTGPRPPRNPHAFCPPEPSLVTRLVEIVTVSLTTANNNTFCPVQIEAAAQSLLDTFDHKCDAEINRSGNEVETQVWNRAHLKALKLAGLLAVGYNPHAPLVTVELAAWAVAFVEADVQAITKRFQAGDVGTGDDKQVNDMKRAILNYLQKPNAREQKNAKLLALHRAGLIPKDSITTRVYNLPSFRNDPKRARFAVEQVIQTFVDFGYLVQVATQTLSAKYNFGGIAYAVGTEFTG